MAKSQDAKKSVKKSLQNSKREKQEKRLKKAENELLFINVLQPYF